MIFLIFALKSQNKMSIQLHHMMKVIPMNIFLIMEIFKDLNITQTQNKIKVKDKNHLKNQKKNKIE